MYKAYKTALRANFQPYEELNKRVDKYQMEIIGRVLLLIKKNSRPRKVYTSTLHKIVEEKIEEERQERIEVERKARELKEEEARKQREKDKRERKEERQARREAYTKYYQILQKQLTD